MKSVQQKHSHGGLFPLGNICDATTAHFAPRPHTPREHPNLFLFTIRNPYRYTAAPAPITKQHAKTTVGGDASSLLSIYLHQTRPVNTTLPPPYALLRRLSSNTYLCIKTTPGRDFLSLLTYLPPDHCSPPRIATPLLLRQ